LLYWGLCILLFNKIFYKRISRWTYFFLGLFLGLFLICCVLVCFGFGAGLWVCMFVCMFLGWEFWGVYTFFGKVDIIDVFSIFGVNRWQIEIVCYILSGFTLGAKRLTADVAWVYTWGGLKNREFGAVLKQFFRKSWQGLHQNRINSV